jgi:hypothetical protein
MRLGDSSLTGRDKDTLMRSKTEKRGRKTQKSFLFLVASFYPFFFSLRHSHLNCLFWLSFSRSRRTTRKPIWGRSCVGVVRTAGAK